MHSATRKCNKSTIPLWFVLGIVILALALLSGCATVKSAASTESQLRKLNGN